MNVDIFKSYPDVRYYFASAVPMMVVVLVGWYFIKHFLARRRQTVRHFSGLSLSVRESSFEVGRHVAGASCAFHHHSYSSDMSCLSSDLQMGILTRKCASPTNGESMNTFSSSWQQSIPDCGRDLALMII